jgi:hypothetical protein
MPLSDTELARVLDAHTRTSIRLRQTVVDRLEQVWIARGGLTDSDLAAFVAVAVPIIESGQRQMAALTDAQLTYLIANQLDRPVEPVGVAAGVTAARGVPTAEVYARPVIEARTAKAPGVSRAAAVEAGRRRLWHIATTDLQLARTHQAVATMGFHDQVVGYRRELRGSENCPLCVVASTQRYRRQDLMPIHPGCDCGVVPIVGDRDPGRIINRERYEQAKRDGVIDDITRSRQGSTKALRRQADNAQRRADAARVELSIETDSGRRERLVQRAESWERRAQEYEDRLASRAVAVRQHGEIGPVLTVRDHKFTGPSKDAIQANRDLMDDLANLEPVTEDLDQVIAGLEASGVFIA